MPSDSECEVEVLVFRYINSASASSFASMMSDWGIAILPQHTPLASPSAPLTYWDYPAFERESKEVGIVKTKVKEKTKISLTKLDLIQSDVITLRETPKHYPFTYVLVFLFKGRIRLQDSKLQTILDMVERTQEAKHFTDALCGNAPYRPVYWFFKELPEKLRGLRGTLNDVASPSGTAIEVERVFPEASYAIYGILATQEDLHTTDLALISVVAHAVERGFRPQMYSLTEKIHDGLATTRTGDQLPETIPELNASIANLYRIQQGIRPSVDEFFSVRKHLIRVKGLVQRVRQVCGGGEKKNLFDLVCDDAITSIEDEITMSQEEISMHLQDVGERLQTVYRHLSDRYVQVNAQRTQNLQRIGLYLQTTVAAFLTFNVLNGLIPSAPLLGDWLYRPILILAVTGFVGGLTYWGLKTSLAEQVPN